jgi:hypothetical protein
MVEIGQQQDSTLSLKEVLEGLAEDGRRNISALILLMKANEQMFEPDVLPSITSALHALSYFQPVKSK